MATLTVEILSPEAALWRGNATALVARSSEGNFTILAQHTAMVGDLVSCVVRVQTSEGEIAFAVHGGYFQVTPGAEEGETLATVLAGVAERVSDINAERAQSAKERAQTRLTSGEYADELEKLVVLADLARAELRLEAVSQYA
ncbi:MAG: ATP synthase F1 subunit epsilon [Acidimicrobiales bacterium]